MPVSMLRELSSCVRDLTEVLEAGVAACGIRRSPRGYKVFQTMPTST